MNKKILLLVIGILLVVPLLSAGLGTFEPNDCVNIKTILNTTGVNISSISYPNSSVAITNDAMTKSGLTFNYTFCNTSDLGIYVYDYFDTVTGDTYVNSFEISNLGVSQSISQAIGSAVYLFLMVIIMFVFGGVGFKLFKTESWWVLGVFFEFFATILLIYNTYLGYEYHRLVTGLPNSNMPETFFYILLFIFVSGGLTCLALLLTKWKKIIRYLKREMKRKDEDKDLDDWDFIDTWKK